MLQCTASILKEQIKLCLSCEGFGNRLCFLETTSNAQVVKRHSASFLLLNYFDSFNGHYLKCLLTGCHVFQNVPPDLAICCFILEQSLSVRALQEMLSNSSVDEVRHNQRKRCLLLWGVQQLNLTLFLFWLHSPWSFTLPPTNHRPLIWTNGYVCSFFSVSVLLSASAKDFLS